MDLEGRYPLLSIYTFVTLAVGAALVAWATKGPEAVHAGGFLQQAPISGVEVTLLTSAHVDTLPPTPAVVSAATVHLAPGAATRPFVNDGPFIFRVERGAVTRRVLASGFVPSRDGTAATVALLIDQGTSVLSPGGVRQQLENAGAEPAKLLVISIVPIRAELTVMTMPSSVPSAPAWPTLLTSTVERTALAK